MIRFITNGLTRLFSMSAEEREIRQAIRDLSAYSDRDLAELGIARSSIPEVVRYGRPEFEARVTAESNAPASNDETEQADLPKAA